jgi:hypothetical protein
MNTTTSPRLHRPQTLQNVVLVLAEPSSFVAGYQQSCHWGSRQHTHGLNKVASPLFDCIAPPDPARRIDKLRTLHLTHLYTLQL